MLTVNEAAQQLGVTPARVRQLIADGSLSATKVGRAWVIREEDLMARIVEHAKPGRPPKNSGHPHKAQKVEPPSDVQRVYDICRRTMSFCPSADELAAIGDPEVAAFRVAVSDFFLQRTQAKLVKQGVY